MKTTKSIKIKYDTRPTKFVFSNEFQKKSMSKRVRKDEFDIFQPKPGAHSK